MRDAGQHGLEHMPPVDHCIASLILSPDESIKDKACCPRPQCLVTDSLLSKVYDIAARTAHIGNALSVLLLAQSQMLQPEEEGKELGDTALHAFCLMSRKLGQLMSTLIITRRQVWLAQAPMSDDCRQALRKLPVVPGQRQKENWNAGNSQARFQRPGVTRVGAWDPLLSAPWDPWCLHRFNPPPQPW